MIMPSQTIATYVTQWNCNSHNRLLEMITPDEEKMISSYNLGRLLDHLRSYKFYGYHYLSHIGYDKFGQRTSMLLGDGTTTCYSYSPERRWLQGLDVSKSSQSLVNNVYVFDPVGNITQATIGQTIHSYQYDDLYRLTSASGNYLAGNATYHGLR